MSEDRVGVEIGADEVLTLAGAAALLRATEGEMLALIEGGRIPAQPVGSGWRLSKQVLLDWLRAGRSDFEARRARLLSFAGIWKDDPDAAEVFDGIERARKQAAEAAAAPATACG